MPRVIFLSPRGYLSVRFLVLFGMDKLGGRVFLCFVNRNFLSEGSQAAQ